MRSGHIIITSNNGDKVLIAIDKITFIKSETEKRTRIHLQDGMHITGDISFNEVMLMVGAT